MDVWTLIIYKFRGTEEVKDGISLEFHKYIK